MLESGNVKFKPELLLLTVLCKDLFFTCLLVELVELSSRNLIVSVKQTNRGRLKGICHSLFVITRTQLNLNKIVISKQYKESHNGSHVRKGTKPASIVLKIIQAGRSSFQ